MSNTIVITGAFALATLLEGALRGRRPALIRVKLTRRANLLALLVLAMIGGLAIAGVLPIVALLVPLVCAAAYPVGVVLGGLVRSRLPSS